MPSFRDAALGLFMTLTLLACGGGTGFVTPRLIRVTTLTPDPLPTPTPVTTYPSPTSPALDASTGVTIDSFKIPIRSIELKGAEELLSEVYYCDADTSADCRVDLAVSPGSDLLSARKVEVEAGTYNQVVLRTCRKEGSYSLQVKGGADIGSSGYYVTKSGSFPATGGSIEVTTLTANSCSYTFDLPTPVVVTDKSSTELGLYFDLRSMMWIGLKSAVDANPSPSAWKTNGCTGNLSGSFNASHPSFLCAAFPILFGRIGSAPIQERYLINNRVILGLYFDSATYYNGLKTPVGGYLRRHYGAESPAGTAIGFDVAVKTVSANSNGQLTIVTDGLSPSEAPYFQTSNFPGSLNVTDQTSGTGTFSSSLSGSGSHSYTVMRLE